MDMEKNFHMVGGDGGNSYAVNSQFQNDAMQKGNSMVKEALEEICRSGSCKKMNLADLGCASGPNTISLVRDVLLTITDCFKSKQCLPDVHFFLNDLPGNDFNTLFQELDSLRTHLYDKDNQYMDGRQEIAPIYFSGVPGSFYKRIFPDNSIDFVHSSNSLHWLSQDPLSRHADGEGILSNKRHIYLTKTSPWAVAESYIDQHRKDFTKFLKSRAREVRVGGQMVILVTGREESVPTSGDSYIFWDLLAQTLGDFIAEGLIKEEELEKFNLPIYYASVDELRTIIELEGSFIIKQMQTFKISVNSFSNIDSCDGTISKIDDITTGRNISQALRALVEPILREGFKDITMEELFNRFAEKIANIPPEKRLVIYIQVQLKKINIG